MKTLHQMNNLERAYLLARLFPDELKALTEFIKKEAELFISNRKKIYNEWTEQYISADLWFNFIDNVHCRYSRNGARLYSNKRTFRDQLFDGYDALFTIHSVIHYTDQEQCSQELKHAIYMLFGSQKLINIKLEQTR